MDINKNIKIAMEMLKPLNSSVDIMNNVMNNLEESLSEEDKKKLEKLKKEIDIKNSVTDYHKLATDLIKKY